MNSKVYLADFIWWTNKKWRVIFKLKISIDPLRISFYKIWKCTPFYSVTPLSAAQVENMLDVQLINLTTIEKWHEIKEKLLHES